jgi:predicted RNA-binding Zn ribbon-like protein
MAKERPAPGDLEHVRAFVNTLDIEEGTDELAAPEDLRAWLADRALLDRGEAATARDLAHALELREALRALMLANNGVSAPPAACDVLDAAAARARLAAHFRPDGTAALEPGGGRGPDAGLGRLVAAVYAAMSDDTWKRLKVCRSDECLWAFWDATKNRSGAWCEMGVCGNRAKARSYRERQRGDIVS